ncbi:gag polymerase env poly [Pyrenophora seminiperda CCB06]|uniref:Gag polymerase env poly n=1 Tax=Pyrenophora seminiperda CCB06 TaxID=1302712 RepID=A0A3M7M6D4_9PLEO|nr:gag polymerase env poly [Pyrenophora seminiperda CCB06]
MGGDVTVTSEIQVELALATRKLDTSLNDSVVRPRGVGRIDGSHVSVLKLVQAIEAAVHRQRHLYRIS